MRRTRRKSRQLMCASKEKSTSCFFRKAHPQARRTARRKAALANRSRTSSKTRIRGGEGKPAIARSLKNLRERKKDRPDKGGKALQQAPYHCLEMAEGKHEGSWGRNSSPTDLSNGAAFATKRRDRKITRIARISDDLKGDERIATGPAPERDPGARKVGKRHR